MKKPDGEEREMVKKTVGRRTFLKAAGVAAGTVAGGGLAGILEARRAPAFAQGTKLHILRWVDF
ncbi:MAG: twin-arginine translocation signal domain-containing protein, partial [Candidatus Methylomirabilales bacterium]